MTSKTARVGILVRTKNRNLTLDQALSGIVRQTFGDWHIRLVNDGGDEAGVLACVAKYQAVLNGRITVYSNDKSVGRGGHWPSCCIPRVRNICSFTMMMTP